MTSGVLLAAGAGRRYGLPKILVPGWLVGAVTTLRDGGCDDVVVVTGAARPALPTGCREVHCPTWELGMGASLRAGLEATATADRVVIHLVDLPDVGADVVRRVLGRSTEGPARAVYGGRPGHPVALPHHHVALLLAELEPATGAAGFLRRQDVVEVECGDLVTGEDVDSRPDGGPVGHGR
ncbi:nucleotidyltransferase family protein [Georgenia sp. H159]|uniref:nucleotidyltransferase family protein n=1 Tax=Georgenia sp. H159 TaxID=3076115 RepID=UPI002D77E094|nr:NTP transferase domain-containing protein [Georgenia sp. H159]